MALENDVSPNESALMYDSVLQDFINDTAKKNTVYKTNLFRKIEKKGASVRQKHEFLAAYEDYIPGFDAIGEEFGSGDYRLNVSFTTKTGGRAYKTQDVTISDRYNKKDIPPTAAMPTAAMPAAGGDAAYMQLLQNQNNLMFQTLLTVIDKVISNNNNNNNVENPTADKFQAAINNLMINSAKQQQELINTMVNRNLSEAIGDELEPEKSAGSEIFDLLKMLWDNFGEKVLKGNKTFRALARSQAQGSEQLQQILKNPEDYAAAYNQLIDDAPQSQVDKLLNILKIPTPQELLNTIPE